MLWSRSALTGAKLLTAKCKALATLTRQSRPTPGTVAEQAHKCVRRLTQSFSLRHREIKNARGTLSLTTPSPSWTTNIPSMRSSRGHFCPLFVQCPMCGGDLHQFLQVESPTLPWRPMFLSQAFLPSRNKSSVPHEKPNLTCSFSGTQKPSTKHPTVEVCRLRAERRLLSASTTTNETGVTPLPIAYLSAS